MQLTLVSSTIFSHRVFSRVFTNSHCPKSCCPSTYTLPNVPAHLWLFHSAAMAGGDVCLGWAFFDNEEKWMGAQFFCRLSWQAISPLEFVPKNWSIRLLAMCYVGIVRGICFGNPKLRPSHPPSCLIHGNAPNPP